MTSHVRSALWTLKTKTNTYFNKAKLVLKDSFGSLRNIKILTLIKLVLKDSFGSLRNIEIMGLSDTFSLSISH